MHDVKESDFSHDVQFFLWTEAFKQSDFFIKQMRNCVHYHLFIVLFWQEYVTMIVIQLHFDQVRSIH